MPSPNTTLGGLSDLEQAKLEWLLWEFDQSWTPEALDAQTEKLAAADSRLRQAALVELIKIDMERQWEAGNQCTVEDYLQRFPQLGPKETVSVELLESEYQVRWQCGVEADLSDFERRFPGRIDQLKSRLQAAPESGRGQPGARADVDTSRRDAAADTEAKARKETPGLPERFGRYHISNKLGEGAMGAVYLAHDTELDRKVAIKVPRFSDTDAEGLAARFYQEARAAAALSHRNICPVYDIGEIEGTHYISMAFIEGRPLTQYTRSDSLLSEQEIAVLVRKLALALEQAHSQGVVHRDLKPANVMIDERQEPVIMDFGLARQLDKGDQLRLTNSGIVMGSPAYMSPEQVEGAADRIGLRSDIYSLGVIFYELLTGEIPFHGPATSVLAKILTEEPARPSELRPGLNPRLEAICLKMLAKRIDDRYQSMQEVADALDAYLEEPEASPVTDASREPVTAREAVRPRFVRGPAEPRPMSASFGRWWRRRAIVAGIVPLLIALGIVIWINKGGRKTKLEVPEEGGVAIKEDGSAEVTLPGGKQVPVLPQGAQTQPPLAVAPFDAEKAKHYQQTWADYLGVPVEMTNSIGMKLVLIPPGEFDMGSTEEEIAQLLEETEGTNLEPAFIREFPSQGPIHRVRITRPFYLGKYEVTLAQFRSFAESTRYQTDVEKGETEGCGYDRGLGWQSKPEHNWRNENYAPTDEHPVIFLTWNDAVAFCDWLTSATGDAYRLPTEAEWEYACRAGSTGPFFFPDRRRLIDYAWVNLRPEGKTYPVGRKMPNPWGLHDILGNVKEWCQDGYFQWYYERSPFEDPTGPVSDSFSYRATRGGGWFENDFICRCATRNPCGAKSALDTTGFRVVKNVELPERGDLSVDRDGSDVLDLPVEENLRPP